MRDALCYLAAAFAYRVWMRLPASGNPVSEWLLPHVGTYLWYSDALDRAREIDPSAVENAPF